MAEEKQGGWFQENVGLVLVSIPWLGAMLFFIADPVLWLSASPELAAGLVTCSLTAAAIGRRFGIPTRFRFAMAAIALLAVARVFLDRNINLFFPYVGGPVLLVAAWFAYRAMREEEAVDDDEDESVDEESEESVDEEKD